MATIRVDPKLITRNATDKSVTLDLSALTPAFAKQDGKGRTVS